MTAVVVAALTLCAPVPPDAGKPPAVEAKLHGDWTSELDCVGYLTVRADGTYVRTRYGPGGASLTGTWAVRWDAVPPTLVMTCKTSSDKDYVGHVWEMKVVRLDGEALEYRFSKESLVAYTRVKPGEKPPAK